LILPIQQSQHGFAHCARAKRYIAFCIKVATVVIATKGRAMIDFGSLKKPDVKARPTDPREIFRKRPSGEGAANDLWQGQAEALDKWYKAKADETLVLLNTGAGKTIIGLLIAQSYVNQGVKNVVYVCSTIDLVRQTAEESAKLGIPITCKQGGAFDNDLFVQGKAFCITTYPALFYSFQGTQKLGALIFDDAHVAGKSIRDAFTLVIQKKEHENLFSDVADIIRPSFVDNNQKIEFESAVGKDDSGGSILLAPPCATFDLSAKLNDLLNSQISEKAWWKPPAHQCPAHRCRNRHSSVG
jgi:hypothetical protein